MSAATGKVKIGKGTRVYYSVATTGDLDARTWVYIGTVQEVKLSRSFEESKVEEYEAEYATYLRGIGDASITLKISRRPGQTAYDAIQAKFENGADMGLALLTHGAALDETGARGWWGDVKLFSWDDDTSRTGNSVDLTPKLSAESLTPCEQFTVV